MSPGDRLHVIGSNTTGIRISNATPANGDWLLYPTVAGVNKFGIYDRYASVDRFVIDSSGNVGIGTTAPQYKLSVNGTIGTKEVVVTNTGWADYVFKPDYRPLSLTEISSYIEEHHHLPGIPSESEVEEKGVSLGDLQVPHLFDSIGRGGEIRTHDPLRPRHRNVHASCCA